MTKERKYILVGGAILLLAGAIYRFAPDIAEFQPLGNEIALKQRKIVKYQQLVQKRKMLDATLIRLNRRLERAESGLLTGDTPALAAVDIQNILNDIASRSEVRIKSMRVLQPVKPETGPPVKDQFLGVPVQITFNATTRQLKEVLYKIEASSKILRVSDMRVKTNSIKQAETIYSTLTIEGFMKKKMDQDK